MQRSMSNKNRLRVLLKRLEAISGPGIGCIQLPSNIKAVRLVFGFKNTNGHMGARYIRRKALPE